MEKNFSREDYLLLAKLAQQTERYHEMIEFIGKFVQTEKELTVEERSIVSAAYKNVVGNKRAELRVLSAIEQKEQKKSNETNISYVKTYKGNIEDELKALCDEILKILDKLAYLFIYILRFLIPNAQAVDAKVFYLKMVGDYNSEYNAVVEKAKGSYLEADSLSKTHLAATHPVRLSLALNMSVFFYEILLLPKEALRIADSAFEEAISNIESVNEENYKDCTLIMQLLRDNLTLWQNDIQADENPQNEDN